MNNPYELLEAIDKKGREKDNELYEKVYKDFVEETGKKYRYIKEQTYGEIVRNLKYDYIYESEYINIFFNILEKYNYHFEQEILDAIFDIVHENNPNNKNRIIKKYIKSPIIDDISIEDKGIIKIYSKFGEFNYILADYYFATNNAICNYMDNHELRNRCHDNSYFLSYILKNDYTISSTCRAYFEGRYHHSYTYDESNNLIIDLCRKSLLKKEDYDRLYDTKEIIRIPNKKMEKTLRKINDEFGAYDLCNVLRIALYYESLDKEKKYIKK